MLLTFSPRGFECCVIDCPIELSNLNPLFPMSPEELYDLVTRTHRQVSCVRDQIVEKRQIDKYVKCMGVFATALLTFYAWEEIKTAAIYDAVSEVTAS